MANLHEAANESAAHQLRAEKCNDHEPRIRAGNPPRERQTTV